MILKLKLTEDHLKLVSFLKIHDEGDYVRINKNAALMSATHILDDVSLILGLRDKAVSGTEEDADGIAFPDDVEKYMVDTYNYVVDNIYLIETLLHQSVINGIKPGEYKCKDNEMIWSPVEMEGVNGK